MHRIALAALVLLGMLAQAAQAPPAQAQDAYPNRPIRLVVPYPAGGTADAMARALGQEDLQFVRAGPLGFDAAPEGFFVLVLAGPFVLTEALATAGRDTLRRRAPGSRRRVARHRGPIRVPPALQHTQLPQAVRLPPARSRSVLPVSCAVF